MQKIFKTLKRHYYLRFFLLELLFFGLTVLAFLPIMHYGRIVWSTDNMFHWQRLCELTDDITHGVWPQFNGYTAYLGTAVSTCYPWLPLLFLVPLRVAGLPPVFIIAFMVLAIMIVGLNVAYFSFLTYDKSKKHALTFASLYCISSIVVTMYSPRGENADYLAIMLAPLALFGWLAFIRHGHYLMMTTGLILMSYTHVLDTLITLSSICILIVISHKQINKAKWIKLLKASILFVLTTAMLWLPIITIMMTNRISKPVKEGGLYRYAYAIPMPLVNIFFTMECVWGIPDIVAVILAILRWKNLPDYLHKLFWLALIMLFFNLRWTPWWIIIDKTPIVQLQFPFRVAFIAHFALILILTKLLFVHWQTCDKVSRTGAIIGLLISALLVGGFLTTASAYKVNGYHLRLNNLFGKQKGYSLQNKNHQALVNYSMPLLTSYDLNSQRLLRSPINPDYDQLSFVHKLMHKKHYTKHSVIKDHQSQSSFSVNLKKPQHNIYLPIMTYHAQKYHLYDNGKPIKHYRVKNGLPLLPRVSRGEHTFTYYTPVMWYRYASVLITAAGLYGLIRKKYLSK